MHKFKKGDYIEVNIKGRVMSSDPHPDGGTYYVLMEPDGTEFYSNEKYMKKGASPISFNRIVKTTKPDHKGVIQ